MMIIYTKHGCSSSKKAKRWLEANNLEYCEKNLNNMHHLDADEVRYLLSRTIEDVSEIVSKRSRVLLDMHIDVEELTTSQLIALIHQHPVILRTPLIVSSNRMQVGFAADEMTQLLPLHLRLERYAAVTL